MEIPPDWDKRITHLKPEDFLSLSKEEIEWAREYERRMLSTWARFPLNGDVYESLRDVEISFVTHWKAPFTGGGAGVLPGGTRIKVEVYYPEPVSVHAQRVDKPELEAMLVPLEDRTWHNYGGYSLSISTEQLNRDFRLLESAGGAA